MEAIATHFLLFLLLLLSVQGLCSGQSAAAAAAQALNFTRNDFPRDFVFGAGTSAYQLQAWISVCACFACMLQYEGATAEDGRTPSIWDTYTHQGGMPDNSTGDVASDGYHKYKEDVKLMGDTGLEAYRFSISWSRLIPNGRGPVNPKGLEYYNNLINELVKQGIQIHITLYHLDFPQRLEDEYAGWLSPRVVEDFTAYADVCFREFGDRVSHWTTMGEPNVIALAGYDSGWFPPNRCSPPFGYRNCAAGNSTVEPYIVAHNSILAHASVVKLYREKYQATQKGIVGMNAYSFWTYSFTDSTADVAATQRAMDFMFGWIMHPLVYGDYPAIMKKTAAPRIPSFTERQSELVRGAIDFIGINHYTSVFVSDGSSNAPETSLRDFNADMHATFRLSRSDPPAGQFVPINLQNDPEGLQHMLEYIKEAYGDIPVYVQENGYGQATNDTIRDVERVDYLSGYMGSTLAAIRNGANVKGYFVWSFLDVFELLAGYHSRFGLCYVDFDDSDLSRQQKLSARWYSDFLQNKVAANIQKLSPDTASHTQN